MNFTFWQPDFYISNITSFLFYAKKQAEPKPCLCIIIYSKEQFCKVHHRSCPLFVLYFFQNTLKSYLILLTLKSRKSPGILMILDTSITLEITEIRFNSRTGHHYFQLWNDVDTLFQSFFIILIIPIWEEFGKNTVLSHDYMSVKRRIGGGCRYCEQQ